MPNDKIAVLGLALFGEVAPCVSDIREVRFAAHFRDSVCQEDTVLAAMLVERRICMPKSVTYPNSAKLVQVLCHEERANPCCTTSAWEFCQFEDRRYIESRWHTPGTLLNDSSINVGVTNIK